MYSRLNPDIPPPQLQQPTFKQQYLGEGGARQLAYYLALVSAQSQRKLRQ